MPGAPEQHPWARGLPVRAVTVALAAAWVVGPGCRSAPSNPSAPWSLEAPWWGPRGTLQADRIDECSGIVRGRLHPDVYWVHNDSGDTARIFAIDREGALVAEVAIEGAVNVDWEDIAADDAGNLYICDVGNNRSERQDLAVYVIREPDPAVDTTATVTHKLLVRYPEQVEFPDPERNFDCEAAFWRRGALWFLTKHRGDELTCLYELEDPLKDGPRDLVLRDTSDVGSMVTAADLSPDGDELAVLCYDYLYLFEIADDDALLSAGPAYRILFEARQCEGITYDGPVLFVVNEQREIHLIAHSAVLQGGAVRAPGGRDYVPSPGAPEILARGYRPPRSRLDLLMNRPIPLPLYAARGAEGEPAPTAADSVQATVEHRGDRVRLGLRWRAPQGDDEPVPVAYVAWGSFSDRVHLDAEAGDRSVALDTTGHDVVARSLGGPLEDLDVTLTRAAGTVSGTVDLFGEDLSSLSLDVILVAPDGGEWSWGGEWSMRAPLNPFLWGELVIKAGS